MLSKGALMLDERNAMSWVVKSVEVESVILAKSGDRLYSRRAGYELSHLA